ncbi:MAG: flagellar hook-length control protein FliK, partial [Sphingomonas sp.]
HFAAEAAATRTALADAQPRLAAIAAERGLALGQTTVGGGSDNGDRQRPAVTPQPVALQPVRAATSADPSHSDQRLA